MKDWDPFSSGSGVDAKGVGLSVSWEAHGVTHRDSRVVPGSVAQPFFEKSLAPGREIPEWRQDRLVSVPVGCFRREVAGRSIWPRIGRFFPLAVLDAANLDLPEAKAFRLVGSDGVGTLLLDFNHPLAGKPLHLRVWALAGESIPGPVPVDLGRAAIGNGPGMQGRWRGNPTDFGQTQAYQRLDSAPDHEFYAEPRMVQHIDSEAASWIRRLHREVLPRFGRVLDLMSSWISHLDWESTSLSVSGLGMNANELDANVRLTERVVQDLNISPVLPWGENHFDAVICSLSIEYLMDPVAILRDIRRVLRPGGIFVITFSNRWFPTKAIAVWSELHEFERMGLVLEWFHAAGGYRDLGTWSLGGLRRPASDPYAPRLPWADPVYAVWGMKEG
jgi:SAM-dependent methyltransferase